MESKFKVGQKWRMRNGEVAVIGIPIGGLMTASWPGRSSVFYVNGTYWPDESHSSFDLLTLIEDAPTEYAPAQLMELDPTRAAGSDAVADSPTAMMQIAGGPPLPIWYCRAIYEGWKARAGIDSTFDQFVGKYPSFLSWESIGGLYRRAPSSNGTIVKDVIDSALAALVAPQSPVAQVDVLAEPNQPLILDKDGRQRFRANALVAHLLDNGPLNMSDLAEVECSVADREQFAQLIGYSLSGYGELSYVTDARYDAAQQVAAPDLITADAAQDGLDAARFVFEHSNPELMLEVELEAIARNVPLPIDWWREKIDAVILAAKAERAK